MKIKMTKLNKFISIVYSTLTKTGNLSPEFNTCAFISLLFSVNLTGIFYIVIIISDVDKFISKEFRYFIDFTAWIVLYFLIKKLFKKSEEEIVNYKVSKKEFIYAFAFIIFLVGTFILMANYARSRFMGC